MLGKDLQELHTRNFYSGNGVWKGMDGSHRSAVIDFFIGWFSKRKHHVVLSAIDKEKFKSLSKGGQLPPEIEPYTANQDKTCGEQHGMGHKKQRTQPSGGNPEFLVHIIGE